MINVIGLIPARSGSRRIKNKNILLLNNEPLISYTIKAALKSQLINRIIVSTDSLNIADLSKVYGAEVPFLRPKEYAQDNSSDISVMKHCIDEINLHSSDLIVYLRPTTPFKTAFLIDHCIRLLANSPQFTCIRTISKITGNNHPYWMFKKNEDKLEPFITGIDMQQYHQSQLLPECFKVNGVVDVFKVSEILKGNQYGNKIGYVEITERYRDIDIDTEEDLLFCEYLLKNNLIKI